MIKKVWRRGERGKVRRERRTEVERGGEGGLD